jgi:U3 small nucleolar ribonucleoprotein protein LCP5
MLTAEDKQLFLELLSQLSGPINEVSHIAGELLNMQKNGELDASKGVTFLDVKNQLMLSYIINMTHLMHEKLSGHSIHNSPDTERLVEIRTVLEKMRPIDQKLKYQIDKLIRTAKMGVSVDNDPLRLKPNPDNLIGEAEDQDGDASDAESGAEKQPVESKAYRPARLAPVYYDGDESMKQKKERQMESVKKRLASSAVVRDLQREYVDGPEEIRETPDLHRFREDRLERERKEYEEKYFIRMSVTKKERTAARRLRTMSGLESLTKFGEFNFLTGRKEKGSAKKRKRDAPSKHKGGSSKKRKFRK